MRAWTKEQENIFAEINRLRRPYKRHEKSPRHDSLMYFKKLFLSLCLLITECVEFKPYDTDVCGHVGCLNEI